MEIAVEKKASLAGYESALDSLLTNEMSGQI